MKIQESGEMYLETIHRLSSTQDVIRSIDIAKAMGFSKPSVSRAMSKLKADGLIEMDSIGYITLTEEGLSIATRIYERHQVLTEAFVGMGIDPQIAEDDACKIEHIISPETFDAIKNHLHKMKR